MRFLILRLGSIGDIVHAMPLASALRTSFRDAEVDWLVERALSHVVAMCPDVSRAITIETRRVAGPGGWLDVIARLRREPYDAALDAQGLLKSAVLARASGARRVIGWSRAHLREPAAAAFYTERVDASGVVHVIDKNLSLLRAVGVQAASRDVRLRVPDEGAEELRAWPVGGARYALINPGATWPNKRWPPDRFGALAARLREAHGLASVVAWGPEDAALADAVVAASKGAAVMAPALDLAAFVRAARRAAVVISGDTGPLHLACAAGAPVVGIFGPTDPRRNGPWAADDTWVSRFERCACHHQRSCRAASWCLLEVGTDEVAAAVARRLGGS